MRPVKTPGSFSVSGPIVEAPIMEQSYARDSEVFSSGR